MNEITSGLIMALKAISKDEKANVISSLLEDNEYKDVTTAIFLSMINRSLSNMENKNVKYEKTVINSGDRELYKQIRENYIFELRQNGVVINQVSKTWAKTASGINVAMPLATERSDDRWFLGLGKSELESKIIGNGAVIIFLCQPNVGNLLDFVLPPQKVKELMPKFSKSGDQLKFNLKKTDQRYYLTIPDMAPVDLTEYKGKYIVLK